MVDLIFEPTGVTVDDEFLARAPESEVQAVRMPVMQPHDVLATKLLAMREHEVDYDSVLEVARTVALWWLGLFGFWLLLVGTSESLELVAGACAATLGAALAEGVRSKLPFDASLLAGAWRIPWHVLRDFALITWALVLHVTGVRPVRSAWVEVPFPRAEEPGRRAVAATLGSVSPTVVVAEIDRERNVAVVHELMPPRGSASVQ